MFEKISGFFKQFGRGRKRQSGETTIMESKQEPGADEFGLDDEFADTDDFAAGGSFGDTGGLGETGDDDLSAGAVSAGPDAEGIGDEDFAGFETGADEPDITTGGTDFDERTISDEISGVTDGDMGGTGDDFGEAFDAGEEADEGFADADVAEAKSGSPIKTILVILVAAVIAVSAGAAFQIFAWPAVSKMVGLTKSDAPALDPLAVLNSETRKKANLEKELAEFKAVGAPAQVQELKIEIASIRDSQGPMEEFEAKFQAVQKSEKAYDSLVTKITKIEGDVRSTGKNIKAVTADIEEARQRVVELAKQTEQAYERFRFELVRADLGRRTLIELRLEDIESFKAEVAELQERLSNLAIAVPAETSKN
jgi:hypothetical protein